MRSSCLIQLFIACLKSGQHIPYLAGMPRQILAYANGNILRVFSAASLWRSEVFHAPDEFNVLCGIMLPQGVALFLQLNSGFMHFFCLILRIHQLLPGGCESRHLSSPILQPALNEIVARIIYYANATEVPCVADLRLQPCLHAYHALDLSVFPPLQAASWRIHGMARQNFG